MSNFYISKHGNLKTTEYTGITRKLWTSRATLRIKFNFKKFNNHETQKLCSVNRLISQKKYSYKCLVKLFAF